MRFKLIVDGDEFAEIEVADVWREALLQGVHQLASCGTVGSVGLLSLVEHYR